MGTEWPCSVLDSCNAVTDCYESEANEGNDGVAEKWEIVEA